MSAYTWLISFDKKMAHSMLRISHRLSRVNPSQSKTRFLHFSVYQVLTQLEQRII